MWWKVMFAEGNYFLYYKLLFFWAKIDQQEATNLQEHFKILKLMPRKVWVPHLWDVVD